MKKYYFLLLGVVYILNFTQLSAQNNEQRISNSITNKTSTPAVLEEEPFDAHRLAVKKYLTPQYLQNSLLPLLQKVGVVSNDFSAFLDYCDPVLSDFKSDLLKLRLDKNFVTSFQLDSLIQTYLPLFSTQKDRFYKGLTPLEPAYANSQNGSELKIINPNNLNNPPQQANGPCVNTDFSDGTTNGWTGSYGTSTIATQTTEKTCAGFLKTYNASTDKCCSLLGSCSAWTASDGYLTANLNNPNQTAGFSSAPNNTAANAGTPGVHVVMTSGFDPIVPGNALPVVPPTGGNSLRLGLAKSGYNAQAIRQTFLVTNANKNFIYKFACVLNDPETGHSNVELPYFKIRMYDQSNNIISCASLDVSTSNAVQVGGFTKVNGQPIFWKNWTEVTIPLNPYMGQNVTIEFVTSNCAQSGHYGYAYVSAECMRQEILASSPAICGGTTVTLTAPPGLASYNWTGPGIQSGQGTQTVVINTAGTYHVSMTTNTTPPFVPCNFSIDTVIGGNPSRPFAKFNAPSGCYGSPIVFTDQSTPTGQITAWEWDFDNNTTIDATTQSPSHTFPAPGTYPVKLRVTWPPCMADTTINVLVTAKPNANFSAPPVCFGNATQFTNSTNLNGASNPQYTWDFNDPSSGTNNTSNSVSPSHLFTAAGTYNVKLTVNTPNCSSDTTIAIKVSGLPKAQFTANDICFGGTTAFTDNSTTSTGTLSTWVWIFSDPNNTNNTSNTQNPTHTYTGAGSFPVTLVVTNSDNCSDDTTINAVVYAPPVANFAFKTFCEGITLNTSGGLITSGSLMGTGTTQAPSTIATYTWDLNNDGTFETSGQNVTVTPAMFSTAGNHPISLTIATNKGCRDTVSGNFVVLPTPTVDAGTTQSVCFNTCATLTGTTSSLTYQWSPAADIANPTNLTTQACPIATTLYHLEVMDGYTYPVFTTADTVLCYNTDTVTVIVKPLPKVNFTAPPVCYKLTTSFTDQTTLQGGTISTWSWDFGEAASGANNTSTLQSPTHTYLSAGTFSVKLQTQGNNGCLKDTTIQVTVHPKPIPNFSFTNACADSANTFNASSTTVNSGSITSYQWDVNNSIASFEYTGQTASHLQGADGTYSVTLVATTDNGCKDTITKTVSVWPEPIADFNYTIVCANTATTLNNTSTVGTPDNIAQWLWDYNADGIIDGSGANATNTYTSGGNKTVELNVKTNHGCTDKKTKQVYVNYIPIPDFTVTNKCVYDNLGFTNNSTITAPATIATYTWDFGDGQNDYTSQPTHLYSSCNTYNVQLTIVTDSGCTANTTKQAQAYCKPTAKFTKSDICVYQTANFNASTSSVADGTISTYQWDFDLSTPPNTIDNQASGAQTTNHYAAGNYMAGLIVTSSFGCKDTTRDSIHVFQKPAASFNFTTACKGSVTQLKDTSTINSPETIVAWSWDYLNDGTIDNTTQNPTNVFTNDGNNTVKLVVTSNKNCRDTIVKQVKVNSVPVPSFTAPNVCFNNTTPFTNTSSIHLGTISAYSWAFGNGQSSTQISPNNLYTSENKYAVCLYTTSDQNCKDSICKDIVVYPLPRVSFTGLPLKGCEPLSVTFNNSSTVTSVNPSSNDQISTYSWVYGNGATKVIGNANSTTNTYAAGTYSVSLYATTNNGCKHDTTLYNYVISYPLPKADFNFNPQPTTIQKPIINFYDLSHGADTIWWDLGDGTHTMITNTIGDAFMHEYKDSGKYTVTQVVQTSFGCMDSIKKTVYIGPDWALYVPNAFTPNGDNVNDYFMPNGYGIIEFEMRIYDRWGNFISRVSDIKDKGWNGKIQDYTEDAQIDVYVYRINFKDVFNKLHQLTGTFTLVR